MKRTLSLAVFLALLWWTLSGHAAPLLLGFGALSVAGTLWIAHRMGTVDHESHPVHMSWRLMRYWGHLGREVVLSNLEVARVVVSPRLPIAPRFLRVRTRQPTDLGKVVLANSITLTPGTVTIDVHGDELLVHALTETSGRAVEEGDLDRRVPRDVEELP